MPAPQDLKFAVVSSALSPDPREAAPRARSAGFAGLQFDAYAPGFSLPELSQSGRREFLHILSSNDQRLASIRADVGPKGLSPGADVDRAIDRLDRAMEAAAGSGTPLLCVDAGPLPEPARSAAPKPKVSPAQAGLIIIPTAGEIEKVEEAEAEPARPADTAFESSVDAALAELGRRADRYGVMVAWRSELASFAALERALRASDCPWFGVDLDPVAILRDRWDAEEVFSRFGGLVRHVRARDAVKGHDRRTQPAPIGRGDTDWRHILALLDEAGYNGWITLDPLEQPDRTAAARAGLQYLRNL
jgi:sugar phosphate isomerase/epimerase